jgi:pimeloyl-ACP methyl ester carboxylesterase
MDVNEREAFSRRRRDDGQVAVVLVHGFLDDHRVWDEVIDELSDLALEFIPVDLAGSGERADAAGPFSYERLADDITKIAAASAKPLIIVGQSMGAAVAELVAAHLGQLVLGMVLVAPVPLAGTQLSEAELEPFASLGDNGVQAQRDIRRQLSVTTSDEKLDRLTDAGSVTKAEVMRSLARCWNSGHPAGQSESRYRGPVLALYGSADPIVTAEMVHTAIAPRFANARTDVIDDAGHWPHAEQPVAVASHIRRFIAEYGRLRHDAGTRRE